MRISGYFAYLFYLLDHKVRVARECFIEGLYLHAFTHDLSKFLPDEFFPYAKYFFGGKKNKEEFDAAVILHKKRNRHHIDYWLDSNGDPIPIPKKYIRQLLCDWRAMSRKFGGSVESFYSKNESNMRLHKESKNLIETAIK